MIAYNVAMQNGGAILINNSYAIFERETNITFFGNSAIYGGAIYSSIMSSIAFGGNSVVTLAHNIATLNGGAMHLSDNFLTVFSFGSHITFLGNIAGGYGGAIYAELTEHVNSTNMIFNETEMNFHNNTALVGDFIYIHVPSSCNEVCANHSVVDIAKTSLKQREFNKYISTPPSRLVLYEPATCIDHNHCDTYLVKNIMLGQEITINGCVLDYYGQPTIAAQFSVSRPDHNYHITDSDYVLISCEISNGISMVGTEITNMENFSVTLISHLGSQSD